MKRIAVVVPVSTALWNDAIRSDLETCKDGDTVIEVANTANGPESIECNYDVACAELFSVQEAEGAERAGCQGVVIYCFADPGLRAAKEKLSIPVVGLCESAMYVASLLGSRVGVVAVCPSREITRSHIDYNIKAYGLADKCVGIRCVEMPVLDLAKDRGTLFEVVLAAARISLRRDDADVIVLGCGSVLGIGDELTASLGVPVVVPGRAALKLCEDLVELRIGQSRRYYGTPPEKSRLVPSGKSRTAR